MKKKILTVFALALSVSILSAQQPAVMLSTEAGWHKIAETTVDFKTERHEVKVLVEDRFSAIKFQVADAPIDLQDLEIWMEDGTKQEVAVRTPVEKDHESREISLKGGSNNIDKIVMVYKTLPNRKDEKATVIIYGFKSGSKNTVNTTHEKEGTISRDRDLATKNDRERAPKASNNTPKSTMPIPEVELSDKTGWHEIGETNVSFKNEKDELAIMGANRYAKLKFKVTEAGIIIESMMLTYGDGTKQDIPVKSTFKEGEESRIIDIPGAEKDITRIAFVYHTIPNQQKEKAHVEIFGLKTNADKKTGMNK